MQTAQRILMIVMVFLSFLFLGAAISCDKEEKINRQWETIRTELFLRQISRTRKISMEVYCSYADSIRLFGDAAEISVEEYRREWDMQGEAYYYLVAWEEIQDYFLRENCVEFAEGSVIRLEIRRKSKNRNTKNEYYTIVSGEE